MQYAWPISSRRAQQGDSGSITVFALMTLIGMIGIGGLAVDAMYFEGKRVAAQDAMDRCSLMAAVVQNRVDGGATSLTASGAATDCMAKSSIGSAGLNTPAVTFGNSERTVTLSGNYTFSALFPNAGNATSKSYAINSASKQRLPNLEITVAVDINHSAFWATFKNPLKTFFNTIAAPDTGNKVTVNIVPFDKNVHLGTMMGRFNTVQTPPYTANANRTCMLLPEISKAEIGVDLSSTYRWSWPVYLQTSSNPTSMSASGAARYLKGTPELNGGTWLAAGEIAKLSTFSPLPTPEFGNCAYTSPNNGPLVGVQVARPVTMTNSSVINAKLDAIVPRAHQDVQYTNSTEAMKWALSFMDDSMRDLFTAQVGDGTSPTPVAGRPLDYTADDTLKVLLFVTNNVFRMPDGNVFDSFHGASGASRVREFKPKFLDGSILTGDDEPRIWRTPDSSPAAEDVRFSIFHPDAPGTDKYWVTQGHCGNSTCAAGWQAAPYQHPSGGAPVLLTWPQVFSQMTLEYLIRQLYMIPMTQAGILPADSKYHYEVLVDRFTYIETVQSTMMDDFADLCEEAKDNGVLIYTLIGSGAVKRGGTSASAVAHNAAATPALETYKDCATSPAHNFTVGSASAVKSTLRLIASNIAQLTLTQ
ncbi:MAG: Tad domain-containing protein [Cypionkella sp.]|nr:Tad domain-containing protein [Cypionkella sp.]